MISKVKKIEYSEVAYNELPDNVKQLIDKAKEATKTSYAPYSKFHVGAALETDGRHIVCGSNQENVAYPSGLCAERTAVFACGAQYPKEAVVALAIAAETEGNFLAQPIVPCAACLQVLLETERRGRKAIDFYLYGTEVIYYIKGVGSFLPFSFDM
jgi:cytidine deaminase